MRLFQKVKEIMGKDDGFSLVELIIVLFLIGIAAGVVLVLAGHVSIAKTVAIVAGAIVVLLILSIFISSRL